MIGDGWDGDPAVRPSSSPAPARARRRVVVVTGSRAEYGLLRPVMRAIGSHPGLELLVVVAGSHLVQPALTFHEVKRDFPVADTIPMQVAGRTSRLDDAEGVARGVGRFARSFDRLRPDWIVVLGDRVEALAAGVAACISGFALAHVHAGDRAEGLADEAIRHALSKMAALLLAATPASGERLQRMGETSVHVVGSPGVDEITPPPGPMPDDAFLALGAPDAVFLMHPLGRTSEREELSAAEVLAGLASRRVLALHPNHDPGRDGILRAIEASGVPARAHLPRAEFVSLLRRLALAPPPRGLLVGNSSAGLIEAAVLRCPAVDVGPRQAGRERVANVVHTDAEDRDAIRAALDRAASLDLSGLAHPYGDGRAGARIADLLARAQPTTRKHNAY